MKNLSIIALIATVCVVFPSACAPSPADAARQRSSVKPGSEAAETAAGKPEKAEVKKPDMGDDILAEVMRAKRQQQEAIARGEGGFPVDRSNQKPEWSESDFVGVSDTTASGSKAVTAQAVPGKPGFVFSPFNNKVLSVKGLPSGTLVADPTYPESEKKFFRVP